MLLRALESGILRSWDRQSQILRLLLGLGKEIRVSSVEGKIIEPWSQKGSAEGLYYYLSQAPGPKVSMSKLGGQSKSKSTFRFFFILSLRNSKYVYSWVCVHVRVCVCSNVCMPTSLSLCLCSAVYTHDFSERNITHNTEHHAGLSLSDHTPAKQKEILLNFIPFADKSTSG